MQLVIVIDKEISPRLASFLLICGGAVCRRASQRARRHRGRGEAARAMRADPLRRTDPIRR
jgi:hypothetical protein